MTRELDKTAVVVPCYNEAGRLDAREFLSFLETWGGVQFLFVDDGSADGTGDLLESLRRQRPDRIRCIRLRTNSGKAEAVRTGFLAAFEGDFSRVGFWDADLATPLDVIPRFCEILDNPGIDLVMGARVRLLGRRIRRKAARHYAGRAFATCASAILGIPVYDTQCGAKMFRRTPLVKAAFSVPFTVRWTFDVEILARMIVLGRTMGSGSLADRAVEYPLEHWIDVSGSKLRLSDFFRAAGELNSIRRFLGSEGQRRRFLASVGVRGGVAA